ncbi:hypothetical protein [Mucilaginibacter pedocola]|uniref:Uncharacterized protein n=1 Tax=Mucilaginibacter pedocola TaxID=1792845 RepID=A0A1S9P935_9SPHI|nr:hypothetical protein [Mucilaginibacter pedocola]OOQ57118.1 hypothetical protein BC343_16490 [Mucilaginibacter pedocola]
METNNNTQKKDRKTVRAAFKAYKYAQQPIADHAAVIDDGAFQGHSLRVSQLLDTLVNIEMIWGSESVNFYQLTEVFKVYTAHRPNKSADTLYLFSTLFELVASILEHKEYLHTLSQQYKFINEKLDQAYDSKEFIFPEFYPHRQQPGVN